LQGGEDTTRRPRSSRRRRSAHLARISALANSCNRKTLQAVAHEGWRIRHYMVQSGASRPLAGLYDRIMLFHAMPRGMNPLMAHQNAGTTFCGHSCHARNATLPSSWILFSSSRRTQLLHLRWASAFEVRLTDCTVRTHLAFAFKSLSQQTNSAGSVGQRIGG
jgi:hypothetical protein